MEIVEATFSEPPKVRHFATSVEEDEPPVSDDEDDRDERVTRRRAKRREKPKPERGPVEGSAAAKTAMTLLSISLWFYAADFLVNAVFMIVSWCGGYVSLAFMFIPGLFGIATWGTGLAGLLLLLGGPVRVRPLAMLAALFALLHVCLVFVLANNTNAGMYCDFTIQGVGWMNKLEEMSGLQHDAMSGMGNRERILREANALKEFAQDHEDDVEVIQFHARRRAQKHAEVKSERATGFLDPGPPPKGMRWRDVSSLLAYFDQVVENGIRDPKMFKFYFPAFFGSFVEVIRLCLILGLMRATATAVRDSAAAKRSVWCLVSVSAALLAAILVSTITASVIHDSRKAEKASDAAAAAAPSDSDEARRHQEAARASSAKADARNKHWIAGGALAVYFIYCGMLVWPAIEALEVRAAADRVPKR